MHVIGRHFGPEKSISGAAEDVLGYRVAMRDLLEPVLGLIVLSLMCVWMAVASGWPPLVQVFFAGFLMALWVDTFFIEG